MAGAAKVDSARSLEVGPIPTAGAARTGDWGAAGLLLVCSSAPRFTAGAQPSKVSPAAMAANLNNRLIMGHILLWPALAANEAVSAEVGFSASNQDVFLHFQGWNGFAVGHCLAGALFSTISFACPG
jgi:hypothetical protein